MKTLRKRGTWLALLMLSYTPFVNATDNVHDGKKTNSPYFLVNSDNPELDQMPLLSTDVDVNIAGVIANVKVKQYYKNNGKSPIEATYVFPGSTRAAVNGMNMTVGTRVIIAQIKEKEQARDDYETAKAAGQTASLLEQKRPNVFTMNVANVLPGDTIIVELNYTELLEPEDGVYEFVYPTVVGPRYNNSEYGLTADAGAPEWNANPYTTEGVKPTYSFDINTEINTGIPLQDLRCTSHEVNINFDGPANSSVKLAGNLTGGNRDYILQYRLKGKQIESGLMLYEGEKENFFLMMVQPPERVTPDHIPGREYIFIVDVSGSMSGFPLETSKSLLRDLIGNLRPTDHFNMLLFAGRSGLWSPQSLPANQANIDKAITFLENQSGGGGTQILNALTDGLAIPEKDGVSRTFVIETDGYVTVERESFELIRNNLGNANFFAFGIGTSVNRYIIEGIAKIGMGEPFVVTSSSEAGEKATKFREYISSPVLTDIDVRFIGFDAYDVDPVQVPDVMADRPIMIMGKYKGSPTGTITITGVSGQTKFRKAFDVSASAPDQNNSALRYLWARKRIQSLDDFSSNGYVKGGTPDHKEQVTALGLKYNLLTQYTSFVAVDLETRTQDTTTSVRQPLPLPEGVSNQALQSVQLQFSSAKRERVVIEELRSERMELRKEAVEYQSYQLQEKVEVQRDAEVVRHSSSSSAIEVQVEKLAADVETTTANDPSANGGSNGGTSAADSASTPSLDIMPMWSNATPLKQYIKQALQYPQKAKTAKQEGIVEVEFMVGADGTISEAKVLKSLTPELDAEALRIVNNMPNWKPGQKGGKAVSAKTTVKIEFKL